MRKMSVIMLTVSLLAYTVLTQLASAQGDWKENRVTNQTSETLYVTFSTWRAASGEVTATGYRTVGYYAIDPGDSRLFHAYKNNAIYFQILTSMTTYLKPQINTPTITIPTVGWAIFDSTDTELFVHLTQSVPDFPGVLAGLHSGHLDLFGFNVVTRSLVDASIDFANVSLGGGAYIRDDDLPTPMDGFIKYTNGSQIIVTNEWVEINQFAEQEETLGKFAEQEETLVNIPDPNLRRTILQRLNSAENAHISQADMKKLTGAFRASNKSIADLTGLEFAVNLKTLILSGNNISDIAPLRHLRADLIALALDGNPIFDIAPLENFPNLKTLVLSRNQITDIAPLRNLTKLETLRLIDDTGRFENLRGQKLAMWLEQGTSISLGDSVNIPDPNLRRTILQRLNSAENAHISQADMKKLTGAFRASNKSIADLTGLEFAVNLKTLILSGNNISDIAPLRHLRADLIALALDGNPIFDIAPLENFPNLKTLVLSRNQITDIAPLRNLTKLETLRLIDDTGRFENLRGQKLTMWLEQGTSISLGDSVNIPDPNLRRTILQRLNSAENAHISQADMKKLTGAFRASNKSIADLTGLEFAVNLKTLILSGNNISDIAPLRHLRADLIALALDGNPIFDIAPLENFPNLKTLVLSRNQITDIAPLKNLTNLKTLRLIDDTGGFENLRGQRLETLLQEETPRITDPSTNNVPSVESVDNINIPDPILREKIAKKLGKDKNFVIDENAVSIQRVPINDQFGIDKNLNFLNENIAETTINKERGKNKSAPISSKDMLKLIKLDLSDYRSFNSPVSDDPALLALMNDPRIRDLTGLEFATNLTHLTLMDNWVSDISSLKNLTNLRGLNLGDNQVSDISPLKNLTNLIYLTLSGNRISDISPLRNLTNLDTLVLVKSNISDISPLKNLTNLTELSLGDNQISDVSPLKNLTNLTELSLGDNQISDVSPLKNLRDLKELSLANNQITDISSLENLRRLKELRLANNQITYVPSLRDWTRLTSLDLANNQISDLSDLSFNYLANSLTSLDLANNQISDLSSVVYLPKLEYLNLANNQISDLSGFENLTTLKKLNLLDNPIYGTYLPEQTRVWLLNLENLVYHPGLLNPPNAAQLKGTIRIHTMNLLPVIREFSGPVVQNRNLDPITIVSQGKFKHRYTGAGGQESKLLGVAVNAMRVEVYIFSRKISSTGVEIGAYAKLYEGRTFNNDDLDDVTFSVFTLPWYIPSIQGLHLDNAERRRKNAETEAAARILGLSYLLKKRTPEGESDIATATLYLEVVPISNGNPLTPVFGAPTAATANLSSFSDVNVDGQVNVTDLILVSNALEETDLANLRVDVNRDGIFTIADLVQVAQHLGQSTGAGTPAALVVPEGLTYATVEEWIASARAADDGSLVFHQGIANLELLLTLIIPEKTVLLTNYPNPFNPETWIPYHLAEPADVTLTIYAIDGKVVRHLDLGHQAAGYYRSKARAVYWDGRNALGERVASGIYFYSVTAGEFFATKKMLILK